MENNKQVVCLLLYKESGLVLGITKHKASLMFCTVGMYFHFVHINAALHKYIFVHLQNIRSIFKDISESVGNTMLIASENVSNDFWKISLLHNTYKFILRS